MADDQPMQTPNRLLSSGRAELSQSLDLWSKELDDLQDSIAQLSVRSAVVLFVFGALYHVSHFSSFLTSDEKQASTHKRVAHRPPWAPRPYVSHTCSP